MNQRETTGSLLRNLRFLFLTLSLSMTGLVISTSLRQNMFQVSLAQPWFSTTLVDYYFNDTILIFWLCIKESKLAVKILWALSFIMLGSIASCFYVFWKLIKVKPTDSWEKLLLNQNWLGDYEKRFTFIKKFLLGYS